jgi:hypothetical protein
MLAQLQQFEAWVDEVGSVGVGAESCDAKHGPNLLEADAVGEGEVEEEFGFLDTGVGKGIVGRVPVALGVPRDERDGVIERRHQASPSRLRSRRSIDACTSTGVPTGITSSTLSPSGSSGGTGSEAHGEPAGCAG